MAGKHVASVGARKVTIRGENSSSSRWCFPMHSVPLVLVLILSISVCYNTILPHTSSNSNHNGFVSATTDSSSDVKRRLLRERLQSNLRLINGQQSSKQQSTANSSFNISPPPDKATSTQHDRQMYSLIKDMKPLLTSEDETKDNLLSHEDPTVAADFVMNTIDFAVRVFFYVQFSSKRKEMRLKIKSFFFVYVCFFILFFWNMQSRNR
jgi:hypothetical protein